MEYTSIHYHCPLPSPGQPRETEAIVSGDHAYERYLIYLAETVYPGRTDLRLGGKTLHAVPPRHVELARSRGATVLDLPRLPKDYVWKSITDEELKLHARRTLAYQALAALQAYQSAADKLEGALVGNEHIDERDFILDEFYAGVDDVRDLSVVDLDRLLARLEAERSNP